MSDGIAKRLRGTTQEMACHASVDMTLWNKHSNACLDAADAIEKLMAERDELYYANLTSEMDLRERAERAEAALRETLAVATRNEEGDYADRARAVIAQIEKADD